MALEVKTAKIHIQGVSKVYQTRRGPAIVALDQIHLTIAEKEFVTLVGPSGCGKSTLLKLIAGLQRPSGGEITVDERPVVAPRRDIGIVFQNPVLLPWRTVLENILLPIEILRLDRQEYVQAAHELLDLVGLRGFEHRFPRELSGGMQQRVAICRSLIYNPSILLMDEPFGALDAMTREEMALELLRIWDEHRKTVVFVTHSIPEAVLLADRVVVMTPRPGRIAAVIEIELPRPRSVDMEFWPMFQRHVEEIRKLIFQRRRGVEE